MKEEIKEMIDKGFYEEASNKLTEAYGLSLEVIDKNYKPMTWDDKKTRRWVYKLLLKRGRRRYTFEFGQSICKGDTEPSMYSVLACLEKHEVGTFEDFCSNYDYDTDSRRVEAIYKAVLKEYAAMCRLFSEDELEILREIW